MGSPLIDQNNTTYAILLVEEIAFLNLNDENMQRIYLLLAYFTEGNVVKNAELILQKYPGCPVIFANELQRLFNLEKKIKKDSAVVVFKILDEFHADDYIFRLTQEIRGLDSYWLTDYNNIKILMVLMPFTNREAAESYKIRINYLLTEEYGFTLNQGEIKFNSYQLSSSNDPIQLIEGILKRK